MVGAGPLLQELVHSQRWHANSVAMEKASGELVFILQLQAQKESQGKNLKKKYNRFNDKAIIVLFNFPCFNITDHITFRIILLLKKDKYKAF